MIAYNLMSVFAYLVLRKNTEDPVNTQNRTFAIDAYFEKSNDTLKLKVTLSKKRRKQFAGIIPLT